MKWRSDPPSWTHFVNSRAIGSNGRLHDSHVDGSPLEVLRVAAFRKRDFVIDLFFLAKLQQAAVQRHHPELASGLDVEIQLVGLSVADEGADRRRRDHYLEGGHPSFAVGGGHEGLRDDRLDRDAELRSDLRLLLGGKDVDDSVDRLRGVDRMQCREDEVAGLGSGDRKLDRFQVAHFTDEDDVGVLPHDVLERLGEGVGIRPQFTLIDDRFDVGMHVLDRVLDRHDVLADVRVDVVDHRREGRRLSRSRGPGDEDEASGQQRELFRHRRHLQFVDGLDLVRDDTKNRADMPLLPVHVHPEARESGHEVRQVEFLELVKPLLSVFREDAEQKVRHLLVAERRIGRANEIPANPHDRRVVDLQVKVARVLLHQFTQEFVDLNHRLDRAAHVPTDAASA